MPATYRTFIRSCKNWTEFARARKRTVDRGLSWSQAKEDCKEYNNNRSPRQISKGTMMEFVLE